MDLYLEGSRNWKGAKRLPCSSWGGGDSILKLSWSALASCSSSSNWESVSNNQGKRDKLASHQHMHIPKVTQRYHNCKSFHILMISWLTYNFLSFLIVLSNGKRDCSVNFFSVKIWWALYSLLDSINNLTHTHKESKWHRYTWTMVITRETRAASQFTSSSLWSQWKCSSEILWLEPFKILVSHPIVPTVWRVKLNSTYISHKTLILL